MSGFDQPFYDITYTTPTGRTKTVQLPRVSNILNQALGASPYLVDWAYKMGQEGVDKNAFIEARKKEGSAAHDYVEGWINGWEAEPHHPKSYEGAWDRFVLEHRLENSEFLFSEKTVYSLELGYAGTLDIGRNGPNGPRIDDIKTKKKSIYKAYTKEIIQCRAYAVAAHEMGIVDDYCDTGVIILKPNGRYTYDERTCDPELWFAVLEVYRQLEKHGFK